MPLNRTKEIRVKKKPEKNKGRTGKIKVCAATANHGGHESCANIDGAKSSEVDGAETSPSP